MGKVNLEISTNLQELTERIEKLEGNVERLNKATGDYGDRSKEAFGKAEKGAEDFNEAQEENVSTADKSMAVFKKLGGVLAATFSVAMIVRFAKASMQAYDQQIKAETKLLTALKGRRAEADRLIKQAQKLQKVTRFGDEETIEAQARLGRFLGDNVKAIEELTPLVQDLATAQGMDLASAADLVAR